MNNLKFIEAVLSEAAKRSKLKDVILVLAKLKRAEVDAAADAIDTAKLWGNELASYAIQANPAISGKKCQRIATVCCRTLQELSGESHYTKANAFNAYTSTDITECVKKVVDILKLPAGEAGDVTDLTDRITTLLQGD